MVINLKILRKRKNLFHETNKINLLDAIKSGLFNFNKVYIKISSLIILCILLKNSTKKVYFFELDNLNETIKYSNNK